MEPRIRFGTDGWRATLDIFTRPRVEMVAQAIATYLSDCGLAGAPIGVAYDARASSRGFADDSAGVLAGNGHDVYLSDRDCPTPVLAWSVVSNEFAGGVMVTASHNPPEYNGIKFIPIDGAPALPVVTDGIEENIAEPSTGSIETRGTIHEVDFISPYCSSASTLVDQHAIADMTIAYDAMHGSGRGVTDVLLERAGAGVDRYRCDADPSFGGIAPAPTKENLRTVVDIVRDGQVDLAIANDGDADRVAVATPDRGYIDGNLLFAALYEYLLETHSGPAIRTVSTTVLIDRIAAEHGEKVIETPVGFKWVADAIQKYDAVIGGEESGGFTISGHVREKDGVLTALLAAAMTGERSLDKRLDRIISNYGEIHQNKIGIDCSDEEKRAVIAALDDTIPTSVAGVTVKRVVTIDGYKIVLADGSWVLVRPSGTEPKLRVYAEASTESRVDTLLKTGRELIEPLIQP